jgi:serine/threonine protein kinase
MSGMFSTPVWDCEVLRPGEVVGRWRVDGYLGAGGGGAVYHVVEIGGTRTGALKVFRGDPENDDHHGADRICQERELISQLQETRGMPSLYDQGEHEGRPYFVREDLDPIEPDELPSDKDGLCLFLRCLLYSLKALHDLGWVHCDVKPWNIARKKGDRICVLIDFGSAHRIEEGEHVYVPGQRTINTINGQYARSGTYGYDAPENSFTPARDIYAVGHVIRDCFKAEVPLEWGLVINHCISNNPAYRYPDVMALLRDVERLEKGELQYQAYLPLRRFEIQAQRETERSLADALEVDVSLEEILFPDPEQTAEDLKVFRIDLAREPRCHFSLRDPLVLDDDTVLVISGPGILDADISGPSSSVVVLCEFASLNNLTTEPPPLNDLTYVMQGPGSYLNFPEVSSDEYRAFFPGRRRILRDLDATTSFRFGGPSSFAEVENDALEAIEESGMPRRYKDVLAKFFRGEAFTVLVSPQKQ